MSQLTKQQLETVNQDNFPNNTTGYITPQRLREFNTDVIDSTVNQTIYTADSTSFDSRLDAQEAFSSSLAIDYINQTELNAATASLSSSLTTTINGKVSSSTFTTFSTSVDSRLDDIGLTKANLVGGNSFTGSQNIFGDVNVTDDIVVSGQLTSSVIKTPYITGSEFRSATGTSYFHTLNSETISSNTLTVAGTPFSSFSASVTALQNFSASQYKSDSGSFDLRLDYLEYWSGTLDLQFATDAQLNESSSTLQSNIDTKLNTSSFTTFSASIADFSSSQYKVDSASFDSRIDILTSSVALTGSNTFNGNQTINGALQISSSATYDVDITGAFQATAASRISGSSGINSLTQTFNQISASTGLSIMSRGYLSGQIGSNQIAIFSSGSSAIGSFTTAPIGIAGIAINSGSTANQWYYPIQFQPSTGYTDGRVTIATPLVVSASTFISGNLNVSGSLQLQGGALNFTGSLTVVDGFDFSANGNKQYNYASYFTTVSQSGSVLTSLTEDSQVGFQNVSGSFIRAVNRGVYQVTANVSITSTDTIGTATIFLRKNGNEISASRYGSYFTNASSTNSATSTAIVSLNANDYIEVGLGLLASDTATSGRISVIQIR